MLRSGVAGCFLIGETKSDASVLFEMGEGRGAEFGFESLSHQFLGGICGKCRIFVPAPVVTCVCYASPGK